MTVQDLSKIIRELISSNEESVHLPGFGSFIVVDTPSEIINDGKAITPPSRKIVFDSSFDGNDPYFIEKYAKYAGISLKSAKGEVSTFLSNLKRELVEKTRVEIPQFGTICFGELGSFVFEAEVSFDFEADSYCLETIPLKARGAAESAAPAAEQPEYKLEAIDIELVDEPFEEQTVELTEELVEQTEELVEQTLEQQSGDQNEDQTGVQVGKEKINWVLWSVLAAVGVIIVMVVLMVVFKDQLRPLLEQLLYSKEELEILHQAGF